MHTRRFVVRSGIALISAAMISATDCASMNGTGGGGGGGTTTSVALNLVKLTTQSTTTRGPAVGDGVLAFNAGSGSMLVWLNAGDTVAQEVPAPSGMTHDGSAFQFAGKKLVVRDGFSGSLYVFDSVLGRSAAVASASINMGGSGGPNLWESEGTLIATVNATVTTADGAAKRIKLIDISDIDAFSITPFDQDPVNSPNAIDIDATGAWVAVRGGNTFYIYDANSPTTAPMQFMRSALLGGAGSSDIQIDGNFVAFFDDNGDFTLLNITNGQFSQPTRNPGRSIRGLALESNRFAFFAMQTSDDGSSVAQVNRALTGTTSDVNTLVDPVGTFVNGQDETDGRVGFGATLCISPNGRFAFAGGETAVGVNSMDRLYLSTDGGSFLIVQDPSDSLNALRAAGVACSDNLVAFLIPTDLTTTTSSVTVGYAALPPP